MKKFLYSLAAISAAFMACSCAKSIEEAPVAEESILPGRTFTCVFAQPDSDTKLALDTSTGKTTWEVGDEILINAGSGGTSRRTVTLAAGDISADGKTATITIPGDLDPYIHYYHEVQDVTSTYYAMYPANAVAPGNLYYNQAFSNQNAFLLAACNVGDTFVFYNLNGLISYKVSGDFDSVSFSGKNGETVAYEVYQARVRDTGTGATITHAKDADSYKPLVPLTTSLTPVVSDGSTTNFIYLPGGASFTGGFIMNFIKSGEIKKVVSSSSVFSVNPGQLVNLGDISSHLLPYVAPTSHDATHPDIAGAEDLGASGTANCYVVDASVDANKDKVFKFKAVKGNSTSGVGKINSVEILWETYNNAETVTANSVIAEADFDKQDGDDDYWITFKMPTTLHAGNALIAARNVSNEILWSWHIWVPSTSIANVNASKICGATMMDRNLGALEKVSTADGASVYTLGMLYQWGRKDPFPGGKRITDTWPNPATVSGTAPSVHAGSITMDYAIAHPTEFASNSGGDWQSTTDMTRWSKDAKTVNDPCPPGYKIPYGERGSKPLWNTTNIETAVTGASMTWELSSTGYWFRIADGDNELVFPLAGYVDDGVSSYGIGNTQTRAAIWCLSDSSSSKYHLNIRYNSTTAFGSTSAARGCSVRCVAE